MWSSGTGKPPRSWCSAGAARWRSHRRRAASLPPASCRAGADVEFVCPAGEIHALETLREAWRCDPLHWTRIELEPGRCAVLRQHRLLAEPETGLPQLDVGVLHDAA